MQEKIYVGLNKLFLFVKSSHSIKVFAIFLALYFCIGMFIFYPQAYFYDDAFFGADSWRVENDITLIDEGHWRLNVHPLFVILVQPIFHILNGVVNNNLLAILLMQATLGALLVTFVYEILCDFNVLFPLRLVMISIFGMGASQLIWSAIPETFLYGALTLCSFWWFLIKRNVGGGFGSQRITVHLINGKS